ncbi:unnamed protein product [Urochloa decumbens]|uniref:F-box domain-containing protein n=1 Tax=Urochloa decumbens TaxID=240449 RepID=A0ABC8ZIX4_9POAL
MDRILFSREGRLKRSGRADLGGAEVRSYEGPDLISRLPDEVLGAIVTLLDTGEGARTAALSRRWRYIWRDFAPLNLDDESFFSSLCFGDERHPVISQIIAAHPGPARRLSLRSLALSPYISHFDAWLRLPVFDSIQELSLHFPVSHYHPEMPASALRFASLRVLDINNCVFPAAGDCSSPIFPCLTHLSLRHVGIAEEHLHGIISNSPGIEAISLDTNFGYRRLCISLPRLRYLAISDRSFGEREKLSEVVVEDAASLERLLLHEVDNGPSVRITGAAKLKILGYLGAGFPIVELGNSSFKGLVPATLVEQFSTVKILALEMPEAPKLKVVIGYLRCFPCLEKLHIMFFVNKWSLKGIVPFGLSAPIECLDRSLKTIVLQQYSGRKPHLEFAKFFVKRARVLEVMKFCTTARVTSKWLENQSKGLNIMERASRCAQFPFVLQGHLPSRFWMDEGFSSDDPFMCD